MRTRSNFLLLLLHQFTVETRGVGNVGNQPVEPLHVVLDDLQKPVALIVGARDAHGADGGPQGGKRVLDLVTDVGGKLFVGVDPVVKRRDHAPKRTGQAPDLVGAAGQVGDAHARGAHLAGVLVAAQFGGGGKVGKRIGDRGGQNEAQADGHEERNDEHLQQFLALVTHQLVDLARGGGDHQHAKRAGRPFDRGGRGEGGTGDAGAATQDGRAFACGGHEGSVPEPPACRVPGWTGRIPPAATDPTRPSSGNP